MGGVKPKYLLNAINCQKIKKELGIPLNVTVLLSVGEVNKNKNHKVVIEALPALKDCYYVLCGRGPLMDEYRNLAEKLDVSDRFKMTGYRTDVVDFYSMADVFVFPSYREGLPVALMEAMAAGLPCLAAKNRGTDDLLGDSELLFEARDVATLRRCLSKAESGYLSTEVMHNQNTLLRFDVSNTEHQVKEQYFAITEMEIK